MELNLLFNFFKNKKMANFMTSEFKPKKLRIIGEQQNKYVVEYVDSSEKGSKKLSLNKNFLKKRVEAGVLEIVTDFRDRRII